MPLCKVEPINKQSSWALWQIEETIEALWKELNPSSEAQFEYQHIHHHQKKLEWLASRLVIKHLVEQLVESFLGIYKDAFGKPHLTQTPLSYFHSSLFSISSRGHSPTPVQLVLILSGLRKKLLRIRDPVSQTNRKL